jgi:hypothetical protein
MSVLDGFKDSLSAEDFARLEESIQTLISDKAVALAKVMVEEETAKMETLSEAYVEMTLKEKAEEIARLIKEDSDKTLEAKEAALTAELQLVSEEYIAKTVEERVKAEVEKLEEKYREEFVTLEESIADSLSNYLDLEITSKISDELLTNIAINETYAPIIHGIRELFESKYVGLDTEGSKIIEESTAKVARLEKKINESYEDKLELVGRIDELKTELLISKKTASLTESAKERIEKLFEGKDYEEVDAKIDDIISLIESKDEEEETIEETQIFESRTDYIHEMFTEDESLEEVDEHTYKPERFEDELTESQKLTLDLNKKLEDLLG